MSDALTEVLREETWLPHESSFLEGKDLEAKRAVNRPASNSPTGSDGRDQAQKKAKTISVDHKSNSSSDCIVMWPFYWQFSHAKDCHIWKILTALPILSGISSRLDVRFLLCEI